MAWHSKRHNIKHRKAATDSKKSKIYSKMAKLIEIAARTWADPLMNPSLDMVLSKAKYASVPRDVIERAIKKWSWQSMWAAYQTIFYEGYAPGWVALYIKTLSDNTNRTASSMRSLLGKAWGTMAEMWAVSRQFREIGEIVIEWLIKIEKVKWNDVETVYPFDKNQLENQLLGLEIEDYSFDESNPGESICRVVTNREQFISVTHQLERMWYKLSSADLIWESTNPTEVDDETYAKLERIRDVLEDDDDVEEVYDNVV